MDDKELLTQCYHAMYQGMIGKDMEIAVSGEQARLVGQSRVNAAVFGGGMHVWRLQLSMKAVKKDGKWYMTEAVASTY